MRIDGQEGYRPESRQTEKWKLPDLSLQGIEISDQQLIQKEVRVPVEFEGTAYEAVFTVERFPAADFSQSNGGPIGKLDIALYRGQGEHREQASSFKAALNHRIETGDHAPKDGKPHVFWRIYTRLVFDESMRGRGFGKLNLALMEKAMGEMTRAMGDVKPEWIEIRTMLGALANLIVDREWLSETLTRPDTRISQLDLDQLAEKASIPGTFSYRPVPSQEQAAVSLLQQRTQKLDDAKIAEEEIVFIRPLSDTSVEQLFD